MDFSKTKPSNNFTDQTGDIIGQIQSQLLSDYYPSWNGTKRDWTNEELKTIKKGGNLTNILRKRMSDLFWDYFLNNGPYTPAHHNFNFNQEDFDTHSNMRKRSQGSSYDNY